MKTDDVTPGEAGRVTTIRELHELIVALDRRLPQVQRAGEIEIARAATELRMEALRRIKELERETAMIARTGHAATDIRADRGRVSGAFVGAANYYAAMAIDLAAALVFLGLGVRWFIGHPGVAVGVALLGFLSFGFLEYAVHRWVLHGLPSFARRGHRHHHAEPTALVATPFFVAAIASIAILRLLCLVCPAPAAALFVFGLYAGYNHFALFHHWVHHHRSGIGFSSYWRRLDRLHHAHHQRQGSNFGVSMTMWDAVFRTSRPANEKRKGSSSTSAAAVPLL